MSARRGLRPRLGCALGAGLRSLGRRPIVGPPPGMADAVVAETVTDTMVGTVSDAAGKAVAAGVAGQALPEPYMPGSGDMLPAELRLVLAGYAGIACGLSAGALACATALVLSLLCRRPRPVRRSVRPVVRLGPHGRLFGALWGLGVGLRAFTRSRRIRFSRLLRRPSDPHTATVMASKRGGRTLILDIPSGRHRPRVPAPVPRGSPRVVDEGRHAGAR